MNLKRGTATLAKLTARHPWTTIGIWVGVMAVAFLLISTVLSGALTTDMVITNNPESKQADTIIADKLGKNDSLNEMVIIRSADADRGRPRFPPAGGNYFRRYHGAGQGRGPRRR